MALLDKLAQSTEAEAMMRKQAGDPDLDGRPKLCVVIQFMPVCTEAPPISVGFAGGSNSPGTTEADALIARMWDAGRGGESRCYG